MEFPSDFLPDTDTSSTLGDDDMQAYDSKIFSPELFLEYSTVAAACLKTYLEDTSVRGLSLMDPDDLLKEAGRLMTRKTDEIDDFDQQRFRSILNLYIRTGIQVYSPGYMGRQFSGAVPLTGILDLVNSILNQPSSFYEAAQLPNVAERIMADELNRFIGYGRQQFTMVTTSGGSLANLTALSAARNDRFPEVWTEGFAAACRRKGCRPTLAVSEDVHYSIIRSAGILGIGERNIIRLPVDGEGRICAAKTPDLLDRARKNGADVFCLVASAGTTSRGAFDPIDSLADIAAEQGIWLHVDGAHGASLLLSDALRHRVHGIEKADSITWDAHKMMFVPSPCSLLFYKNKEKSHGAFRQEASYVFEKYSDKYTDCDSAEKNFECTKRPVIMNLWMLWALYGRSLFARKIEYLCRLCRQAYEILTEEADFETLHAPESNILCFRYKPPGRAAAAAASAIPDYQVEIRNKIRREGTFFISKVDVGHETALRVVFMNHRITPEHFRRLLDEIRKTGQNLIAGHQTATTAGRQDTHSLPIQNHHF
jgi:L-2,4-diaminobutyrate decarboxylase